MARQVPLIGIIPCNFEKVPRQNQLTANNALTRSDASIYNALVFATHNTIYKAVIEQLVRAGPVNYLLKIQLVALPIIIIIFWLWQGQNAAVAAGYGAAIGVINTLMTKWHLIKTAKTASADPARNMSGVYRCIIERWVVTLSMFVAGFVLLKTAALYLLAGFIAMQFVALIGNKTGLR